MAGFERFVLNTGRSGSTMLTRMLAENRQMLVLSDFFSCADNLERFPSGPMNGERLAAWMSDSNDIGTLMYRRAFDIPERLNEGGQAGSRWSDPSRLPGPLNNAMPFLTDQPEVLFDELLAVARRQPVATLTGHCRVIFGWLAERFGRKGWLERSGSNLTFVDGLRRTFPEARYVHLHRDGLEASMSMREHNWFKLAVEYDERVPSIEELERAIRHPGVDDDDPVSRYYKSAQPPLEQFGRHWAWQICKGYREFVHLRPEQLIDVSFEELMAHPQRELGRIAAFFELPDDPGWMDRAAGLIDGKLGRRAPTILASDEHERLATAVRPGQVLLGREDPCRLDESYRRIRDAFNKYEVEAAPTRKGRNQ